MPCSCSKEHAQTPEKILCSFQINTQCSHCLITTPFDCGVLLKHTHLEMGGEGDNDHDFYRRATSGVTSGLLMSFPYRSSVDLFPII